MTAGRRFIVLGAAVLALLLAAGISGYAIGTRDAATAEEAASAKSTAQATAFAASRRESAASAMASGRKQGAEIGRTSGLSAGSSGGKAKGKSDAEAEQAIQAAAAEEAAALAEAQERAANCGAPLFVDGYCPTDEEIARESAAESLCGGGTPEGREEAAALGIQC